MSDSIHNIPTTPNGKDMNGDRLSTLPTSQLSSPSPPIIKPRTASLAPTLLQQPIENKW